MGGKMIRIDLEETNRSAHRVTVNSRGPGTKPCEYWWQKTRDNVLVPLTQERVYHHFFKHGCSKGNKNWSCRVLLRAWQSSINMPLWVCFLPEWQMIKQDTFPSLLISLPSLPHPQLIAARPHKRDWVPFAICTSPIIHLACIVFNFS